MTQPDAKARARAAYERALFVRAALGAWPVVLLIPLALLVHRPASTPPTIAALGAALAVALVACGWRGGAWRRGGDAGLVAGVPLFLVPMLVAPRDACAHACAHGPAMACVVACTAIGAAAGLALGLAARRDPSPVARALAGVVVAGLVGSLTCVIAGSAALLGAAAGLAAGTAPLLVFARR
jgi:hypothetical protein